MAKRIDIALSSALSSMKLMNVHGEADPMSMLTAPSSGAAETIHGEAEGVGSSAGRKPKVGAECIHGVCSMSLPAPQKVSRVEVRRGPSGELIITLHE